MSSRLRRAAHGAPRRAIHPAARAAAALLVAALAAPGAARAQAATPRVTPRCSAFAAGACAAIRFDLAAAADAPLALTRFDAQLAGDYTFAGADFTGEDSFSFGTRLRGTARVSGGRDLFVEFLASPGYAFELGPGEAGYLEFGLRGAGDDLVASYQLRDADGEAVPDAGGGSARVDVAPAPSVVPEPATLGLVATGAAGLLAARARRRAAAA